MPATRARSAGAGQEPDDPQRIRLALAQPRRHADHAHPQLYQNLLGPHSTTAQRRHLYARYLAAETEFWRSHRACAAVMHFCGLGYSRPDGQTSDHWADVERLTWEPEFYRYVRDAFAPVGLMIDAWAEEYPAGHGRKFPVVVINDIYDDWQGNGPIAPAAEGRLSGKDRMVRGAGVGQRRAGFAIDYSPPAGRLSVEAISSAAGAEPVRSLRDFGADRGRAAGPAGLAVGKPVKASSNIASTAPRRPRPPSMGGRDTRWSSEFSDPQWIAVDLGQR